MEKVCKDCIFFKYCGNESRADPCSVKKTKKDVDDEIKRYDDSKKEKRPLKIWMRKK